jgi:hypothetical protein
MPTPTEVFLSHSSQDRQFANRIGEVLDAHGLPYWYSQRDVLGAQRWHDAIGEALSRCDWFLLILSPAAVDSSWVKRELLYALEDKAFEGRIVVLDYQPAAVKKLSWTLPSLQWVDFRHDFDNGCRDLLRIWGRNYRP